ncbi:hypothetical protein [Arabiibacter massiliensis]|uniref:hypothetical protein n=1 Tax=Arabiibacter massiliensis TaxID=1870985 RepID=UPI0009BA9685|nr:hypothetical protein [Arabiibacter massiliensis]
MNAAAALAPKHARPAHAETPFGIRVIAGGLIDPACVPLHARAERPPLPARTLRGVPYRLDASERAFAVAAGILFAAVALAVALL